MHISLCVWEAVVGSVPHSSGLYMPPPDQPRNFLHKPLPCASHQRSAPDNRTCFKPSCFFYPKSLPWDPILQGQVAFTAPLLSPGNSELRMPARWTPVFMGFFTLNGLFS